MNPRVIIWLRVVGLPREAITRRSGEDLPLVTVGGVRLPWTTHYSEWIMGRWTAWARELGYRSHDHALRCGCTDDEFDAWLRQQHRHGDPSSERSHTEGD